MSGEHDRMMREFLVHQRALLALEGVVPESLGYDGKEVYKDLLDSVKAVKTNVFLNDRERLIILGLLGVDLSEVALDITPTE